MSPFSGEHDKTILQLILRSIFRLDKHISFTARLKEITLTKLHKLFSQILATYHNLLIVFLIIFPCIGGLVWIDQWNALQHPVAASFLALLYSDYMLTSRTAEVDCSGKSFTPSDLHEIEATF